MTAWVTYGWYSYSLNTRWYRLFFSEPDWDYETKGWRAINTDDWGFCATKKQLRLYGFRTLPFDRRQCYEFDWTDKKPVISRKWVRVKE